VSFGVVDLWYFGRSGGHESVGSLLKGILQHLIL
jgi:hypothetical protein